MRYTIDEKRRALAALAQCEGDFPQAAAQTGIRTATLKRWAKHACEHRPERVQAKIEQVCEQLADDAMRLAAAIETQIDDAPLNQLATALSAVIDRYLKLDEHLALRRDSDEKTEVIRVEYQYPDGTCHDRPPWAAADSDEWGTVQGGRVRAAVWQDGNGQDGDSPLCVERESVLVALANLPDGESGLAGLESQCAEHYPAAT